MSEELEKVAKKAISAEIELQDCYRKMSEQAKNPKVKAVIHDLLLMEEMNEVLLRSLNQNLGS
jgi:rubrerythrin